MVQAQLTQPGRNLLLLQDADHHRFAEGARQDGDPEVDIPAVHAHFEPAVLRNPALGNVQFRHDLDARDQGRVQLDPEGLHRGIQHAVNAVLDVDRLLAGFDVDVAGAFLEGAQDDRVHQFDDGTLIVGDLLDREHLLAMLILPDQHGPELGLDPRDGVDIPFALLQGFEDRRARRDHHSELPTDLQLEFVEGT